MLFTSKVQHRRGRYIGLSSDQQGDTDSVFRYEPFGIFSVFTIPIPKENSVSIFGIKKLAGAPQKIGGSPLFPKKGGPRPPLCTLCPPFEEKKELPRNYSKKEFPQNLKIGVPAKAYSTTIPTENTDTGCI